MAKKNQPAKGKISKLTKLTAFWVIVALIGLAIASLVVPSGQLKDVPINDVVSRANAGKIEKLDITGNDIKVTLKGEDRPTEKTIKETGTIYEQGLKQDAKVQVNINQPSATGDIVISLLTIFLPIAIIIGFFMFMMRQAQGQNNQAMSFGKSRARLYGADKKKVSFKDVAGNDAAKQDLEEVVDFLKFPKKYEQLGAKIPRGVLLAGAPGTGKTMMARAVASEAGVPFFSISGSEFVEMFAGVGASRVRDLFSKAKKNAPSIIFIDEIDAVAHKRDTRGGNGREDEQTLNQILVEMDGFDNETGVIVIAATNRADMLDPALLRPGRFDRRVTITLPERADRLEILKVHFKNKPLDSSVNLDKLAAKTAGSSGADLANIANEAAINTARANRKTIASDDVDTAFEKVAIGPERKSKIMNDKDRELSAYHEAGHAIVGHVLPDSDPVHKVTIIPRGQTGGVTWFLPPEDKSYTSIYEYKDILARALGGRMAETLLYGNDGVTTGAGSDLKHASEIARNMVVEEGMGQGLRNRVFTEDRDFFGVIKPYSDQTAEKIDKEVAGLIDEAGKRAELVLKENRKYLDSLAKVLLDRETVEEDEVNKILKGATLPKTAKLHD